MISNSNTTPVGGENVIQNRISRDKDIILEAINEYDAYVQDDDYDADLALRRIIERMRDRFYLTSETRREGEDFQARVGLWMCTCFGAGISADKTERNHRFLEEALELVQACGCTASEAHQLVEYVFNRPVGNVIQEVGGVMVTLAALCSANGVNMDGCAQIELERVWGKVEQIRAKQAAKPKHSPLPGPSTPLSSDPKLIEDRETFVVITRGDGETSKIVVGREALREDVRSCLWSGDEADEELPDDILRILDIITDASHEEWSESGYPPRLDFGFEDGSLEIIKITEAALTSETRREEKVQSGWRVREALDRSIAVLRKVSAGSDVGELEVMDAVNSVSQAIAHVRSSDPKLIEGGDKATKAQKLRDAIIAEFRRQSGGIFGVSFIEVGDGHGDKYYFEGEFELMPVVEAILDTIPLPPAEGNVGELIDDLEHYYASPIFGSLALKAAQALEASQAEVASLRETLEPFAKAVVEKDGRRLGVNTNLLTTAEWFAAASALSTKEGE